LPLLPGALAALRPLAYKVEWGAEVIECVREPTDAAIPMALHPRELVEQIRLTDVVYPPSPGEVNGVLE